MHRPEPEGQDRKLHQRVLKRKRFLFITTGVCLRKGKGSFHGPIASRVYMYLIPSEPIFSLPLNVTCALTSVLGVLGMCP